MNHSPEDLKDILAHTAELAALEEKLGINNVPF